MNDSLKNPFLLFLAGVLAIWLVFRILKIFAGLGGAFILVFAIMFMVHPPFRTAVQRFFASLFGNNN